MIHLVSEQLRIWKSIAIISLVSTGWLLEVTICFQCQIYVT